MRMRMVVLLASVIALAGAMSAWAVVLDESNATLADGPSTAYSALATPDDGSTPNYIIMGAGSASWAVGLTPGQKYKLTTRRTVLWNNELRFDIFFDGVRYITDLAYDPNLPDTMQEWTALGYYMPSAAATVVSAQNPGSWAARIDWISLDATSDVYFDENTAVTFQGNAALFTFNPNGGWPANPMTLPIGGPNGFYFDGGAGAATITGNVSLVPGSVYNVYASRQVLDNGNLGYDINIGGAFFTHDGAVTVDMAHNDYLEEALLGQYVATSALTEVQYANPGPWGSRPDYLRFEMVPEPGSLLVIFGGLASFAGMAIRRRK